ncbi:hypothetical protein O1W71_02175 [Microbacterium sp. H37-C3]|uniref:hypothetical protein n=1 Tax=Microbacterium sp. H37-C3 TaxID=3004354 RepID=UPI0022AE7F39|nr:hypothetical protein [Microbacterium sp. H37-C3]MCZ4066475.1 hypothetical protein [Microbacterium sp. H37-C3]
MRIITVRQPFADAIIFAGKDVENRPRNIAGEYRGPVLIHAGLHQPSQAEIDAFFAAHTVPGVFMAQRAPVDRPARGVILGVVDVVDVHPWTLAEGIFDETGHHPSAGCSRWAYPDGWHLKLANPRALAEPIPFTGALGMRRAPFELAGDWIMRKLHHCTCPAGASLGKTIGHAPGCGLEQAGHLVPAERFVGGASG